MPGTAIWVGDMGGSKGYGEIGQNFGKGFGDQLARELDPDYQAKKAREDALRAMMLPRPQAEAKYANEAMTDFDRMKLAAEEFNLSAGKQKLPGELELLGNQNRLLGAQTENVGSDTRVQEGLLPFQQREIASQTNERDQLLPWKIADYPHKWANDRAQVESQRLYYSQKAQQENDIEFLKLMVTSGDRNSKMLADMNARLSKPGIPPEEAAQARIDAGLSSVQSTLQMIQGMQASPTVAGKVDPQFLETELASGINLALDAVASQKSPEKQAAALKKVTASFKQYRTTQPAVWQRYIQAVGQMNVGKTQQGFVDSVGSQGVVEAMFGARGQNTAFDPVAQVAAETYPQPYPGVIPSGYNNMFKLDPNVAREDVLRGMK